MSDQLERLHQEVRIPTIITLRKVRDPVRMFVHYYITMWLPKNYRCYQASITMPLYLIHSDKLGILSMIDTACLQMEAQALEDEDFGSCCVTFTRQPNYIIGDVA